ncbi:hypothetical protein [Faecalimonas umbilicata]|uniref:hypothetical protein n=1 Tax=Faecalimonas umbilicata TaxID=1912855 RepID=UPI0022E2BC37|nr:hypothetical protein [Faecalimonas umbilicata]
MGTFKCLNCRIGQTIIKNYKGIFKKGITEIDRTALEEMSKNLWDITNLSEENYAKDGLLEKLIVLSRFTYEYDPEKDEKLTEHQMPDKILLTDLENCMCLEYLKPIISALKGFYNGTNEAILEKRRYLVNILNEMNELNKRIPEYKYDSAKNVISRFSSYNESDDDKVASKIANGLKYIFKNYFTFSLSKNAIQTPAQCFNTTISEIVQESQPLLKTKQESKQFIERVNHLPKQYAIIMQEYLKNALKNIGITLNSIMELQDMTEQDVAKLLDCKANKIQALRTQKSTNESQDFINLLSRGLFVSESVIRTGYGQKFGNWNDMLKGDILKEAMEDQNKSKTQIINQIRENIHSYIESEENFKKILEKFSNVFETEEIAIFSSLEECFENLLHKEDAYTLLEVLEKLNNA